MSFLDDGGNAQKMIVAFEHLTRADLLQVFEMGKI